MLNSMVTHKRKWFISGGIALIIIVLVIASVVFWKKNTSPSYTTLTSSDGTFSIAIHSDIEYRLNTKENTSFPMDLYSVKDEMYFYVSRIEKTRSLDLSTVIEEDKASYLADKQNVREDSGITQANVKDYTSYEYNLLYYDALYEKDFYSHVIWIETEHTIYILNFEIVAEHADSYKEIFIQMKNSFIEL